MQQHFPGILLIFLKRVMCCFGVKLNSCSQELSHRNTESEVIIAIVASEANVDVALVLSCDSYS